jgi:hypothetical protein
VSTLHSLALRTLRAGGLLTAYPADPLVLDSWEARSATSGRRVAQTSTPRTRSETTIKKAEYAQGLVAKDPEISQTKLSEALIEKFGTGMDFRVLSNIKAGREPFKMAKKKRKKKAGRKKRATKATKATKKRTAKKAKKRGRPRKKAGRQ